MKPIETARDVEARQARALWSWQQQQGGDTSTAPRLGNGNGNGPRTDDTARGLVVTAAQDLGFFARAANWRCASCGTVHRFEEQVPVSRVSPCACASIEFQPQRDGLFATTPMVEGDASPLLT